MPEYPQPAPLFLQHLAQDHTLAGVIDEEAFPAPHLLHHFPGQAAEAQHLGTDRSAQAGSGRQGILLLKGRLLRHDINKGIAIRPFLQLPDNFLLAELTLAAASSPQHKPQTHKNLSFTSPGNLPSQEMIHYLPWGFTFPGNNPSTCALPPDRCHRRRQKPR